MASSRRAREATAGEHRRAARSSVGCGRNATVARAAPAGAQPGRWRSAPIDSAAAEPGRDARAAARGAAVPVYGCPGAAGRPGRVPGRGAARRRGHRAATAEGAGGAAGVGLRGGVRRRGRPARRAVVGQRPGRPGAGRRCRRAAPRPGRPAGAAGPADHRGGTPARTVQPRRWPGRRGRGRRGSGLLLRRPVLADPDQAGAAGAGPAAGARGGPAGRARRLPGGRVLAGAVAGHPGVPPDRAARSSGTPDVRAVRRVGPLRDIETSLDLRSSADRRCGVARWAAAGGGAVLRRDPGLRGARAGGGAPGHRLADRRGAGPVTYTQLAVAGVLAALAADHALLRTRLVRRRVFWVAYAIVLAFQLLSNGVLTGRGVVRYDERAILS